MPSPMLTETTFDRSPDHTSAHSGIVGGVMTAGGTARAEFILLGLLVVSGTIGWALTGPVSVEDPQPAPFSIVALVVAFGAAVWAGFRPARSPVLAPVYALSEGLALGSIAKVADTASHGVVLQAALATLGVVAVMAALYAAGVIRVTSVIRTRVIGAGLGLLAFWLLTGLLAAAGVQPGYLESAAASVAVSIVSIVIAAWFLALDFALIEDGVRSGAPKHMEWQAALGLLVTIVWIFVEFLELLGECDGDD